MILDILLMAILIVDDESSTRNALREMLVQQGHKVILEAKNGEEGLKALEASMNKIRMIIADWEMPYMDGLTLAGKVGENDQFDLIPFLLITSDLPKARLAELKLENPRMDHAVLKPFRLSTLATGIQEAQMNRARTRDTALFVGDAEIPDALVAVLQKSTGPLKKISKTISKPGAVFILPTPSLNLESMQSFRKTNLGSSIPWICLSRDPEHIFPVRTLCHTFYENLAHCETMVASVNQNILHSWQIEILLVEIKLLVQQKNYVSALKILKKAETLNPDNPEIFGLLGDVEEKLNHPLEACAEYERAALINPCSPRPYIKLFNLSQQLNFPRLSLVADAALLYCPQNQDVLLSAAEALKQNKILDKSREIVDAVLKLNPKSEAARKLLSS